MKSISLIGVLKDCEWIVDDAFLVHAVSLQSVYIYHLIYSDMISFCLDIFCTVYVGVPLCLCIIYISLVWTVTVFPIHCVKSGMLFMTLTLNVRVLCVCFIVSLQK